MRWLLCFLEMASFNLKIDLFIKKIIFIFVIQLIIDKKKYYEKG
jgi:hypothetical protein